MARLSQQVQPVDQPIRPEDNIEFLGPNHPNTCANSGKWNFCGNNMPRSQIVFFVQVVLVYIVAIVSIVNLTIGSGSDKLWIALLSSSTGYILPNPSLKINKPQ